MALVPIDKSDVFPNPNKVKKFNNYVKINKQANTVVDQVVVASHNATSASTTFQLNHTFTSLSISLYSIMSRLLTNNMITLPPIQPLLPTMLASKSFDSKDLCQYHHQNGHDTKKCYSLKYRVQDLIDSDALYVDNFDGSVNKFVSPPNQNFQIYTNPLSTSDTIIVV